MHIIRSWRDSLLLFLPSQAKLFFMVCLLSTVKTFQVLSRQWIFFVLVAAMCVWGYVDQSVMQSYLCVAFNSGMACVVRKFLWHFCAFILSMSMVLLVCAASRPSIGLKNTHYFQQLLGHMILILSVIIAIQLLGYLLMFIGGFWCSNIASVLLVASWARTHSVLYVLYALFFFDTNGVWTWVYTSAVHTAIMVLYNLPLIIIIALGKQGLEMGAYALLTLIGLDMNFFAWYILWLLLMPFIVNVWTNIYIKKLHEHPDLYFATPK